MSLLRRYAAITPLPPDFSATGAFYAFILIAAHFRHCRAAASFSCRLMPPRYTLRHYYAAPDTMPPAPMLLHCRRFRRFAMPGYAAALRCGQVW